jgi:hypothetical protein
MKIGKNHLKGAAIASIAALTSCTSSDFDAPVNNEATPINFSTYLQKSSRGTDVTTASLQTSGFSVIGYQTLTQKFADYISADSLAAADFMVKQAITYNNTQKAWEYSPVQYWPTNAAYRISFFAYGPTDKVASANVTTTGTPKIKYNIKPTSGTNIAADAAYDLVAAAKTDEAYFENEGKVAFAFSHVLSRIGITIKTSGTREKTSVYVTDVKINGNKCYLSGTYDIYANSWSNKSAAGKTMYSLNKMMNTAKNSDSGITGVTVSSTKASVFSENNYLFMVPTFTKTSSDTEVPSASSDDFVVDIEYAVVTEGSATILKDSGRFDLNTEFLQGKAYTLNFTVSLSDNQIVFDDIDVDSWTNNTTGSNGDTSTGNNGSDVDTSDPSVFTDYYLFGDDNNLTWTAQETNLFTRKSDGSYYLENVSFSGPFMIGESNASSHLWGLPMQDGQHVDVAVGGTYTVVKGNWNALNYNSNQTYKNVTLKFTPDAEDKTATLKITQN